MSKSNSMELNDEQRQAIEYNNGPLLIVAGAGTGKTSVITEKIKWLLAGNFAKPEEILALTFTEKSAKEMETRVDEGLPYGTFGLWISTFHSFCDRILRNEAINIGLSPSFKLMTQSERFMFVKKNFWQFNLREFRPLGNPFKFIEGMLAHFDRLKDEDILPTDYKNSDHPELVFAYKTYEELKVKEGVMDYSDLIANVLKLYRSRPKILKNYQDQFKYILVDEFQDTNFAQNEMLNLLASDHKNITVVADDDQSIYRFRGAAISNVLQFRKSYQNAKIISLVKNYRSSQEILDRSYDLITKNNPDRLEVQENIDKRLVAELKLPAEKIELIYVDRAESEAEKIAGIIKELSEKYAFKDIAILVRANNHADTIIRSLERSQIPHQFLGPGQLFHQPEVKDLISYLKFLADFTDSASLYRVMSMDIFEISQREIIEMLNLAKKKNISLFEEMEVSTKSITAAFVEMVHRHQGLISKETGGQILYFFLKDTGLLEKIINYDTLDLERKAQNITKFFEKLKAFETKNQEANVFAIVEYLNLAMDMGESPLATEVDWTSSDAVNILTIHSAKGLEFPVVFLVNLIEGRFPTRIRKEQIPIPENLIKEVLPEGDYHIQEERRLFYVGMTRAKEKLYFTAANFYGEGKRERKLSPFVTEAMGEQEFNIPNYENQEPLLGWEKAESKTISQKPSKTKIDSLSYSAIETFKTCPLHYKLKYILKILTPPNSALSMGNAVHQSLKDFYQVKGQDIIELLQKNWIQDGYTSKQHEKESFEKAKAFLTDYLDSELHRSANPILLEQKFSIRLDDLKLTGKIDRIDDLGNGEIEIIDYKTGANIPTQKDIDTDLQMSIYALAAIDRGVLNKPVDKVKMSFYYFDTQSRVTTTRSLEDLESAKRQILEIRDEIEKSDFLCSHSQFCQNCEFKILCNN